MKQRVAARLLLASCTFTLGIGIGIGVAVTGLLDDDPEGPSTLSAIGRGIVLALLFTLLAALLARRALVTASRLRAAEAAEGDPDPS